MKGIFVIVISGGERQVSVLSEMGRGGSQGETPPGAGALQFLENDF